MGTQPTTQTHECVSCRAPIELGPDEQAKLRSHRLAAGGSELLVDSSIDQPLSISFQSFDNPTDGVHIHAEVYVCSTECAEAVEERLEA